MSEEVNSETLMSLLKEKAKVLKQTEKKLKKIEEKYVEVFKLQKDLQRDRDTFIQFLHVIFPQHILDELLLPEDKVGLYDIDYLKNFWTLQKKQSETENTQIIEVMREEKQMMYQQISDFKKDLESKQSLERRISELEAQQTNLLQELRDSQQQLFQKDKIITSLQENEQTSQETTEKIRQLEKENNEIKAAQLMNSFGSNNFKQNKQYEVKIQTLQLQISEKSNEVFKLKDYVEGLEKKLEQQADTISQQQTQIENQDKKSIHEGTPFDQPPNVQNRSSNVSQSNSVLEMNMDNDDPRYKILEQQLKDKEEETERLEVYNQELDNKLQKLLNEFSQMRTKAQSMLAEKENEIDRLKGRSTTPQGQLNTDFSLALENNKIAQSEISVNSSGNLPTTPTAAPKEDQLNNDYLKNVLVKYLVYIAKGNEKEAITLEKVLFTVLKFNEPDVTLIEKARRKNSQGIWGYFAHASQVPRPIQPRHSGTLAADVKPENIIFGPGGNQSPPGHRHSSSITMGGSGDKKQRSIFDPKKYFNINI